MKYWRPKLTIKETMKMLDPEHENPLLKDYKYKEHEEWVETNLADFIQRKFSQIIYRFFGVPTGRLTKDEVNKFKKFAFHEGKRSLNALLKYSIRNNKTKFLHLVNADEIVVKEQDLDTAISEYMEHSLMHDLSHSAAEAIRGNTGKPRYYKLFDTIMDPVSYEDMEGELYAGLFQEIGGEGSVPILLNSKNLRKFLNRDWIVRLEPNSPYYVFVAELEKLIMGDDVEDFEMWVKRYIAYMAFKLFFQTRKNIEEAAIANLEISPKDLSSGANATEYSDKLRQRIKDMEHATGQAQISNLNKLINHPPEKFLECAHYVFDNRKDPRVIVNLFFKVIHPEYFENLDQRYKV